MYIVFQFQITSDQAKDFLLFVHMETHLFVDHDIQASYSDVCLACEQRNWPGRTPSSVTFMAPSPDTRLASPQPELLMEQIASIIAI